MTDDRHTLTTLYTVTVMMCTVPSSWLMPDTDHVIICDCDDLH